MIAVQLKQWFDEFRGITECPDVPDTFWRFLGARLQEQGIVPDDPDVVLARIGEGFRHVRIKGRRSGGWLTYENIENVGWGIVEVRDIHPDHNSKLAEILDRLEGTVP